LQHPPIQQAEVTYLNVPKHQPQQTGSTSESAYAIQPPTFGFCAISTGKQKHPKTTQGGYRGRHQKAGKPTVRLHHQSRAERPECRPKAGQPEKEPNDSRLLCLAERAGDRRERHGSDGGAGQSVKSARYQEHSTRLRDRCE
jgi:hypothetical protein